MQQGYVNNVVSEDNSNISWEMIKLPKPFSVYCPMVIATIEVHAESLEEIDQFTLFLLQVVANGQGPSMVEEVTLLSPGVIEEEFRDMIKMGLIEVNTDKNLILAELGQRYFRLMEYIHDFNSQRVTVQINMHTGIVVENNYELLTKDDLPSDCLKLKSVINKQIFWNENPVNTRDLYLAKYGSGLNNEDREEIHINLILEDITLYRPLEVYQLPALSTDRVPGLCDDITKYEQQEVKRLEDYPVVRPIIPFKLDIKKTELDYYRHALSTLAEIEKLDAKLLSTKAQNLISSHKQEHLFSNKLYSCYFDLVTGEIGRLSSIEQHESEYLSNKLVPYYNINDLASEIQKTILKHVLQDEDIDWNQWESFITIQEVLWIKQWIPEELLFGPEDIWFKKLVIL